MAGFDATMLLGVELVNSKVVEQQLARIEKKIAALNRRKYLGLGVNEKELKMWKDLRVDLNKKLELLRKEEAALESNKSILAKTKDLSDKIGFSFLNFLFTGMMLKNTAEGIFRTLSTGWLQTVSTQSKARKEWLKTDAALQHMKFVLFDIFANSKVFNAITGAIRGMALWISDIAQNNPKIVEMFGAMVAAMGAIGVASIATGSLMQLIKLFGDLAMLFGVGEGAALGGATISLSVSVAVVGAAAVAGLLLTLGKIKDRLGDIKDAASDTKSALSQIKIGFDEGSTKDIITGFLRVGMAIDRILTDVTASFINGFVVAMGVIAKLLIKLYNVIPGVPKIKSGAEEVDNMVTTITNSMNELVKRRNTISNELDKLMASEEFKNGTLTLNEAIKKAEELADAELNPIRTQAELNEKFKSFSDALGQTAVPLVAFKTTTTETTKELTTMKTVMDKDLPTATEVFVSDSEKRTSAIEKEKKAVQSLIDKLRELARKKSNSPYDASTMAFDSAGNGYSIAPEMR